MGKTGAQECNQNIFYLNISDPLVLYSATLGDQKNMKIYSTEPYFGRFCAPIALNEASQNFYDKVIKNTGAENKMDEYFSDLRNSYGIILISFAFAFIISLFYMIILRWCTGFFVWTTILLFLALILALAILCHTKSNSIAASKAASSDGQSNSSATSKTLYWFAVALYILFAITLCLICCYFKTIELCIAVLKSAAIFVKQHFCIINVPVIFSIVLFGYLMFGMFVLLFLWSIGTYQKRAGLPFGQVQWDTNTRRLIYVHLYTVILNGCIILYYGQFIIIASASIWYFNQGDGEAAYPSPVKTATWWGTRYHMGSIVFAAFLLSFIIVVKMILMYIQYQAEKIADKSPTAKLVRCVLCMMQCLVSCFERLIKFISKTGLTMVAITGKHFCSSCKQGLYLIMRHPLKFGLVGVLGEVFVFLGKIFVAVITTVAGYLVVTNHSYYQENLYSPVIPCIFFFFIGLIVGSIFMAVYGLSADAIMCCYFVDKELVEKNGKSIHRAPQPLREFFSDNKTDSGSSGDEKKPTPVPEKK
jgi:solute carrier family 44 (choline transporter-like protein), member 2/4/5